MPKNTVAFLLFFAFHASAVAQCDSVSPQEISQTCKVLRIFMNSQTKVHSFEKALPLLLTYEVINEFCTVPQVAKNYFSKAKTLYKSDLEKITLTLSANRSTSSSNNYSESSESRYPTIIRFKN